MSNLATAMKLSSTYFHYTSIVSEVHTLPSLCIRYHSLGHIDKISQFQFGTQVKFRCSREHNNRTAENAFSAPWYFSEMELESAAG